MLSCYRILDLTDEKAFICGKALSDFGAEVIKIERPGGDPARRKGPFYQDDPDPEKNLTWLAFNANKKGITLDIEKPEGQALFKKLVEKADVVLESFAPGYLDKLGLGYETLRKINPKIILTTVTGFGQRGPYRDYKAPDIVVRALGGLVYTCGYEDRPPLVPSYEHTYYVGAMYAAVGTMTALCHRALTGRGQRVDASTQQAGVIVCSAEVEGPYALLGQVLTRHGRARSTVLLKGGKVMFNPLVWECKDGDIAFNLLVNQSQAKANAAMIEGVKKDGTDVGFLEHWDWEKKGWADMTLEEAQELVAILSKFFKKHTKAELLEMAVKNRFQLGPSNNAADALQHPQLAARGFWKDIPHPELGTSFKFPGGGVTMSEGECGPRRRAPRIGEHNAEIYEKELGLPAREIAALQKSRII
jgi:crotonobetainyl-CoA:carnitine CoA-transferase CaiB-like acyl-CoA transferase